LKSALKTDLPDGSFNPLDSFERFLRAKKARYTRAAPESLSMQLDDCQIDLFWHEDDEAVHLTCALPVQLPEDVRDLSAPVVMHINRRQWLGHFEIQDDGVPCYRYTTLFHSGGPLADSEVLEEVTDIALRSSQQYLPAFQLMSQATNHADFPRLFQEDGKCAPLGLALLDTGGQG